jgi:hypothetical protein
MGIATGRQILARKTVSEIAQSEACPQDTGVSDRDLDLANVMNGIAVTNACRSLSAQARILDRLAPRQGDSWQRAKDNGKQEDY